MALYRERYTYTTDGYLQDMFLSTWNGSSFAEQSQAASTRNTDLAGRVTNYVERNGNNSIRTNLTRVYDRDNRQTSEVDATQVYNGASKTDTYVYNANGTLGQIVTTNVATSTTRSFSYQWWDSAKQTELRVQANGGPQGWAPGVSKLSYDVNGNLYRATDVAGQRTTQYVTDGDGQILYRQEIVARAGMAGDWNATTLEAVAGAAERKRNYYYLNGHRIGDVNNENGAPSTTDYATALAQAKNISNDERNTRFAPTAYANFDENYQPINDAYPGAAPVDYTVAEGDTLNSIAARIWGDRAMWYLIADANGLSGSERLSAGTRLVIPNKVANIHNNSGTFKVYDAGEAIGDVSPTLPPPPPPPNKGCGGLGQIIMVVIAVVVTIYTAGAAAGLMGATGGAWSAGLAVMGGTSTVGIGALGAAAIGGAAGSIASQGFAMAAGMQDEFSWKAVGQSALGGAITAGVGMAANNVGMLSALKDTGSAWAQAGRAALGSSVNQALHGDWNWQTVTASALGAGVGTAFGGALGSSALGQQMGSFGTQVVSGFVGGVTAQWAGPGGRANYGSAFAGALGGVLGNALGGSIADSMQPNPASAYDYRNGSDIESDAASDRQWFAQSDSILARRAVDATARQEERDWQLANADAYDRGEFVPGGGTRESEEEFFGRVTPESRARAAARANQLGAMPMRSDWDEEAGPRRSTDPVPGSNRDQVKQAIYRSFAEDVAARKAGIPSLDSPGMTGMEKAHLFLDGVNLLADGPLAPVGALAGLVDAGLYLYEGKRFDAGMSLAGTVPLLGATFSSGRFAMRVGDDALVATRVAELGQEGHALARHGGVVTNDQLLVRATTGVAPDGSSIIRNGQIQLPQASTAFNSDQLLARSDMFVRERYLDQAIALEKPGATRVSIEGVDTGVTVGRGYGRVTDVPGGVGPVQYLDNLSKVTAHYVYDSLTKTWQTVSIYPVRK